MPKWDPDYQIPTHLAGSIIETAFPQLAPVRIQLLAEGWDNCAFLVNEDWIFRFPRREIASLLMQREISILPWLNTFFNNIPNLEFIGSPDHQFKWPYAGYRQMPGRPACYAKMDDADLPGLATSIGSFLKQLHALPLDVPMQAGIKGDELDRWNYEERLSQLFNYFEQATSFGHLDELFPLRQIAETSGIAHLDDRKCLLHGDFHMRNFLVDEDGRLSGIFDWGDVHLGHRALDLSIVWTFFPAEVRSEFFKAYGDIDDETWKLARFRGLYMSLVFLLYAHDIGDQPLVAASKKSLEHVRQD